MAKHRLRIAAAVLAGAALLTGASGTSTSEPSESQFAPLSGYGYDGTNPATTGCANSSYAIWSTPIKTSNGQQVGTLEVRYSTACGTNWVRMQNNSPAPLVSVKSIERRTSPRFWETESDYPSQGWTYSMQVYAPGSTCVYVGGALVGAPGSGLGVVASIPEKKLC